MDHEPVNNGKYWYESERKMNEQSSESNTNRERWCRLYLQFRMKNFEENETKNNKYDWIDSHGEQKQETL